MSVNYYANLNYGGNQYVDWTPPQIAIQAQGGVQRPSHVYQAPQQVYQVHQNFQPIAAPVRGGGQQVYQAPNQVYQAPHQVIAPVHGGDQQVYQAPNQIYQASHRIALFSGGDQVVRQGDLTHQPGSVQAQGGVQRFYQDPYPYDQAQGGSQQFYQTPYQDYQAQGGDQHFYQAPYQNYQAPQPIAIYACGGDQDVWQDYPAPQQSPIQAQGGDQISQEVVHLKWGNYQLRQENYFLNQRINILEQRIDFLTTELQRVTVLYERSERAVHFTTEEVTVLRQAFLINPSPPMTKKQELSDLIKVPIRKITSWFKRQRKIAAKNAS